MTLMEMLVVIAIIGIVAAILLPSIAKARMRARVTECMNNLKQIGYCLQIYADGHGDRYPIWPDSRRPEFTEPGRSPYALDALIQVQLSAADSPNNVLEKVGLGCLYPDTLRDEHVLTDPGGTIPMEFGALIDPEQGNSKDVTVWSGYFYVNADFETEMIKGPIGLNWQGFKTPEPVVWCAQDDSTTPQRFAHNHQEINCLYMDTHVDRIEPLPGQSDDFIVRPSVPWTVHEVLGAIKQVSGTYNQKYPP
jgi:prepilin-type N-terminal cleavage/methylation domain-containing protein